MSCWAQRVCLREPSSDAARALPIIESSDLIATVPRDLANICVHHGDIRIVEPPFKSPAVEVRQFWHRRFHQDAANVWLRGLVQRLFGA